MAEILNLQAAQPAEQAERGWFCATPTAEFVHAQFDLCMWHQRLGLVVGESGCGKSSMVRAYQETHESVAVVTLRFCDTAGWDPHVEARTLCGLIVEACGGRTYASNDRQHHHRMAVEAMRQFLDRLLVIDEAHLLGPHSLLELRNLAQEAAAGICLVGEDLLLEKLQRNAWLASFRKRLGASCMIALSEADLRAFLRHYELPERSFKTLWKVACSRGWHGVEDVLLKARTLANGKLLTFASIEDAARSMRSLDLTPSDHQPGGRFAR